MLADHPFQIEVMNNVAVMKQKAVSGGKQGFRIDERSARAEDLRFVEQCDGLRKSGFRNAPFHLFPEMVRVDGDTPGPGFPEIRQNTGKHRHSRNGEYRLGVELRQRGKP